MLKKVDLQEHPPTKIRLLPTAEELQLAVRKKLTPLACKPPLSDALATHDRITLSLDDSGRLQIEFSETATPDKRTTSIKKKK